MTTTRAHTSTREERRRATRTWRVRRRAMGRDDARAWDRAMGGEDANGTIVGDARVDAGRKE